MTKKLEELFNIGPVDDESETELVEPDFDDDIVEVNAETEIMEITEAMEISNRINVPL